MKKILVSKKVWREIHRIKNDNDLGSFSKTVDYLISKGETSPKTPNPHHSEKTAENLEEKDIVEIRNRVDTLIKSKNPEGKASENQHSIAKVEILCLQCSGVFLLDESYDEMGFIVCPYCNHRNDIIYLERGE